MNTDSPVDAIVIGAGLGGLLAAAGLQSGGARVLVLDKGRGVGGRLATRRTDSGVFDHGAQFFTARDPQFRLRVEAWQEAGIVRAWAAGFALADGTFKRDGETRFCGVTGMSSIAKHLAQGLDVRVNATVVRVQTEGPGWVVRAPAFFPTPTGLRRPHPQPPPVPIFLECRGFRSRHQWHLALL